MTANKLARGVFMREAHIEPSPISTKSEVDRLETLRAKPAQQQALRPKYIDHARIDNRLDKNNERRLIHQKTRLMVADYQLNRDRLKAVNNDRAKTGFNKASLTYTSNQRRIDRLRANHKGRAKSEFNLNTTTKLPERSR